jgi:hypothetical protein
LFVKSAEGGEGSLIYDEVLSTEEGIILGGYNFQK